MLVEGMLWNRGPEDVAGGLRGGKGHWAGRHTHHAVQATPRSNLSLSMSRLGNAMHAGWHSDAPDLLLPQTFFALLHGLKGFRSTRSTIFMLLLPVESLQLRILLTSG